ncbi:class I SAM-dependent methyltransferase [Butyrivibrio sp. AD3002]|uniref:class I SAM-dependent methyltransferase n=1 Tax=Butyrivibrio sp. AD3002 TaxID=1280670 RepID=UPI0003B34E98|nr:class I SAM-dependent methyltransferase [Butyrivibrio sp. AD3002]
MRDCPICSHQEFSVISEIKLVNFDANNHLFDNQVIKRCKKCGFVYHDGIDFSKLDEHYSTYTSKAAVRIAPMTDDELVLNSNMVKFIEHHLEIDKEAKILDVGCGYGWVLGLLKDRGYVNIHGIDTDAPLIGELGKYYDVRAGNCETTIPEFEGSFDVIIIKMVMEHLLDPRKAVGNMRKWLKTGGYLAIEVPDCSLYEETAFFPGYFQSVNMEHINNYSIHSLCNLMNEWRLVASESTDSQGIFPVLRAAFKKMNDSYSEDITYCPNDAAHILQSMNSFNLKSERLKEILDGLAETREKCIVWGCSAYTRGLLTYTKLRECNIAYFVDGNSALQEKKLIGKEIKNPLEICDSEFTIVVPGKTSKKSILASIEKLNLKNKILCLS